MILPVSWKIWYRSWHDWDLEDKISAALWLRISNCQHLNGLACMLAPKREERQLAWNQNSRARPAAMAMKELSALRNWALLYWLASAAVGKKLCGWAVLLSKKGTEMLCRRPVFCSWLPAGLLGDQEKETFYFFVPPFAIGQRTLVSFVKPGAEEWYSYLLLYEIHHC